MNIQDDSRCVQMIDSTVFLDDSRCVQMIDSTVFLDDSRCVQMIQDDFRQYKLLKMI